MTLLDHLDYQALEKNRPVFSGFSDITAMHLGIGQRTDLVTYHGPVLYSIKRPGTPEALDLFIDMIAEPAVSYTHLSGGGKANIPDCG